MLKNRILLALIVALVAICLSPFLLGDGVRVWIWWKARQEKLTVKIDKIEAPFLRPVTLRGVHVTTAPDAGFRIDLSATEAKASLKFKTILLGLGNHALQNLSITGLRLEIHRNPSGAPILERSWMTWQKLLPASGNVDGFDLRVEDGPAVILLRGGSFSLSEIEAGRVAVEEFTIASPLVRQTFSRLRGATRWQDNHLTFAGLSLTRGLDVQSITADLSRLGKKRLGLEFDVDAFGGKIRGDISNEWRSHHSNWNMAASASDISLSQTADAIGFADRLAGRLHACKLTFRGDLRDPINATASLWIELTAPAWRKREADVLMLGAALYNRQVALQQLYVRQKKNQLTLTGDAPIPNKLSDWLTADFRADISASISTLGDFAGLFGASRDQFAGEISIDGAINSRGHKLGGQVSAAGKSLVFFHSPVDLFAAKLNLAPGEAEIGEFNLQRGEDFLRAEGKIDMSHEKGLRGTILFSARNLSDYFSNSLPAVPGKGRFDFNGRTAFFDSVQVGVEPGAIYLSGTADFTDLQNAGVTLKPLSPIFEIIPANAGDCIDRLEISPLTKSVPPLPRIDHMELRGAFADGIHSIKVTTDSGEKTYRISCTEGANRALQIGVKPN